MALGALNQTGSRWEAFVDDVMAGIEEKVGRFEQYATSEDGQYRIAQVQLIATFAAAIILGIAAPFTVAASAGAGVVVSAFSGDQLENVKDTFSRISENLPTSVKALAVVIAFTYAPILFPLASGLSLGFEIGSRISPSLLAKSMDDVAEVVGVAKPDDKE
jgi:hypothetical protein